RYLTRCRDDSVYQLLHHARRGATRHRDRPAPPRSAAPPARAGITSQTLALVVSPGTANVQKGHGLAFDMYQSTALPESSGGVMCAKSFDCRIVNAVDICRRQYPDIRIATPRSTSAGTRAVTHLGFNFTDSSQRRAAPARGTTRALACATTASRDRDR